MGVAGTDASLDAADDCLGCRITGTATLLGVAAYFFNERSKVSRTKAGERHWLLVCTGAFAAAGLWRATTGVFPPPNTKPVRRTPPHE